MRVYVAGPISLGGTCPPEQMQAYIARFHEAAEQLRISGHDPQIPIHPDDETEGEGRSWVWYMRRALQIMLSCEAILLLPSWERSKGAVIEHGIAVELGYKIGYYSEDGWASTWDVYPNGADNAEATDV